MKYLIHHIIRVYYFYYDGFRTLSWWGRKMWIILIIKLFIIFAILKVFFFPDFLNKKFSSEQEKSEYVIDQLINSSHRND